MPFSFLVFAVESKSICGAHIIESVGKKKIIIVKRYSRWFIQSYRVASVIPVNTNYRFKWVQ